MFGLKIWDTGNEIPRRALSLIAKDVVASRIPVFDESLPRIGLLLGGSEFNLRGTFRGLSFT